MHDRNMQASAGMLRSRGIDIVRFNFPGFPLNPVGYALAMNFGVDYYWFGLILALIVKSSVQRYSGLKGYDWPGD